MKRLRKLFCKILIRLGQELCTHYYLIELIERKKPVKDVPGCTTSYRYIIEEVNICDFCGKEIIQTRTE